MVGHFGASIWRSCIHHQHWRAFGHVMHSSTLVSKSRWRAQNLTHGIAQMLSTRRVTMERTWGENVISGPIDGQGRGKVSRNSSSLRALRAASVLGWRTPFVVRIEVEFLHFNYFDFWWGAGRRRGNLLDIQSRFLFGALNWGQVRRYFLHDAMFVRDANNGPYWRNTRSFRIDGTLEDTQSVSFRIICIRLMSQHYFAFRLWSARSNPISTYRRLLSYLACIEIWQVIGRNNTRIVVLILLLPFLVVDLRKFVLVILFVPNLFVLSELGQHFSSFVATHVEKVVFAVKF